MEHETFFLSLRASRHIVAFDPSVTLVHQSGPMSKSYNAARQVESEYLQYLCRNFPRIATWHLPYWKVDCMARTLAYRLNSSSLPWPLLWDALNDSSTIKYSPAGVEVFVVIE